MAVNSEDCLDYEKYARLGDARADYVDVGYEESKSQYADHLHAAHGMLFARSQKILWGTYNLRGIVLMQMRFDGVLGFPGGLIELNEDPVVGLNREMGEEIGLDVTRHSFTEGDHIASTVHKGKKLVLHFFSKELSEEEFKAVEKRHLEAAEYGIEVMGPVRVPLYTMADGLRGLPAFLANQFIGNARHQLVHGLQNSGLLTAAEVQAALNKSNQHLAMSHGHKCHAR